MFENVTFGAYAAPEGGGGEEPSALSTAYNSVYDYIANLPNEASDMYKTITAALSPIGSSIAQIASEASSWTSAKTDETHQAFEAMVARRRNLYQAIQRMPEGAQKDQLMADFNSTESYVTTALFPLANEFYSLIGYSPVNTNLGAFPVLIGLALVGAAVWVGTHWVDKHYDTIAANPALADTGISGGIGKGITGMLWLLGGVVAVAVVLPYVQNMRKKLPS